MDKKAQSKPMREILKRLPDELFTIVVFGDDCILNKPVESWPVVDALITFYSNHFPMHKALEYVKLHKPYMINDLEMGEVLKDRRKVYELLESQGINVPFHVFCNRNDKSNIVEEFDEYVLVNGIQINKPLVEKPIDAEDHNIYIYYPMSAGGGSKRLFRKIDDRSSEFYPSVNELRPEGFYIYESFVVTQGTDVKVYTVGPDYGHAEARKSPVVDGRVKRDSAGLEIRYPVILSPAEKEMAFKIVLAFKQKVCGFDILRVKGKSYCCDVNGFSFVKNSRKYYDDASQILTEIMVTALRPEFDTTLSTRAPLIQKLNSIPKLIQRNILLNQQLQNNDAVMNASISYSNISIEEGGGRPASPSPSIQSENDFFTHEQYPFHSTRPEELRCVIAVIRHGDRTPKQKMKIKVTEVQYLDYFHNFAKSPTKELKVKSKSALVRFLDITRDIILQGQVNIEQDLFRKLRQIRDVLERWEISGINRKLQMKPQKWAEDNIFNEKSGITEGPKLRATEILLILKWGGDLTPLGREQAESVGTKFRHLMYPDHEGGGVLRLHSTYRHDLKIKASDEGRVMKTAAAFAKGLLELEGQLTPILASLVTVEEKNRQMLDKGGNFEIKADMDRCKDQLNLLQTDTEMNEDLLQKIAPDCPLAVKKSFLSLNNPLQRLKRMHTLIGQLCMQLNALCYKHGDEALVTTTNSSDSLAQSINNSNNSSTNDIANAINKNELTESSNMESNISTNSTSHSIKQTPNSNLDGLYLHESLSLMTDRWEKIFKDFFSHKTSKYDLSKVPDVYDMIRFDILHNSHLKLLGMKELFELSSILESSVVPQEYGIDRNDKRVIGSKLCGALLEKIKYDLSVTQLVHDEADELHYQIDHSHAEDLAINSLGRSVRTRLYFTSESHLHTLLNVFRYPADGNSCCFSEDGLAKLNEIPELSYLTQVVIRLFEDSMEPRNFRCEISFSPGATNDPWSSKKSELAPYIFLNKSIPFDDFMKCVEDAIQAGKVDENNTQSAINMMLDLSMDGEGISIDGPFKTSNCGEYYNQGVPSPPPLKRNESICVVSASKEAGDKWEKWEKISYKNESSATNSFYDISALKYQNSNNRTPSPN